jgi:toxin-antitoxin system PIN domain toxin
MKPCLAEANVVLALLARRHVYHVPAVRWYDDLEESEGGICRVVQLTVVRLLGDGNIMGRDALSAADAWSLTQDLLEDDRLDLVSEPAGIDALLPSLYASAAPTARFITDAYLAAFAIAANRRLVAFDPAFHEFSGLDVDLLQ